MKLKVELVPGSSWGNNLRDEANIPRKKWDELRKGCYERAGHKCEICGGVSWRTYKGVRKKIVECHEIWSYDDKKGVQKLEGLIALCSKCHRVKHIGREFSEGRGEEAVLHMMKVNDISEDEACDMVNKAFALHGERSGRKWDLDLTWLEEVEK